MPQFTYEAKDNSGRIKQGIIEAYSEDAAVDSLHDQGLVILSLASTQKGLLKSDITKFFSRPNNSDIVAFTRQLATIISADVPLVEGLQVIAAQSDKPSFAEAVGSMTEGIRGGSSLSRALAEYPKLFSSFYISLVKSGEVSGRMEETLTYLAEYLEKNQALSSKIRGALAYPIFILTALLAVTTIMMTSIMPKLLDIIKEAGVQDIPLITRILMAITGFVNSYIVLLFLALVALAFFVTIYVKTEAGHYKLDRIKITFPRLGIIARNIYLARFSETIGTLIKSKVPILESLKITSEVVGNLIYRDILLEARENVRNGGAISEVTSRYPQQFPRLVSSMLAIGEKTGKTDSMLDSIFKFYNFEAERDIQNMSQLIEPILILLLGAGVGLLVAGILLPIFSLVGAS